MSELPPEAPETPKASLGVPPDVPPEGQHVMESSRTSQTTTFEQLPQLKTPHHKRKLFRILGLGFVAVDLAIMPITYYFALKYGTGLSLQATFAILTGVFGMISFAHFGFRSLRLFLSRWSHKNMPVGWTKWGLMEFLHVNILIIIFLIEVELVVGTIPEEPWVRLCAMAPPTISFYLGFLSCGSAILTIKKVRLPFNMSSTEKGQPWRPALLAFIEDAGGVEGGGGVEFRKAVVKRWEVSPQFRSMIMWLSWVWGIGFILNGIVSTIIIFLTTEDIGFGVGWGLPWVWAAAQSIWTVPFTRRCLKKEWADWGVSPIDTGIFHVKNR